jgi:hypothetical protein
MSPAWADRSLGGHALELQPLFPERRLVRGQEPVSLGAVQIPGVQPFDNHFLATNSRFGLTDETLSFSKKGFLGQRDSPHGARK